jgi:hypothetical protein
MQNTTPTNSSSSPDRLTLVYDGGLASNGVLLLPDYAESLDGWRDLFQVLGELYFHSFPELRKIKGTSLLRIEIVAERRGSFETVLEFMLTAAVGGIIGNRMDALTVWAFPKLVKLYQEIISEFVHIKSKTSNYLVIAADLKKLISSRYTPLDLEAIDPKHQSLFDTSEENEPSEETDQQSDKNVDKAVVLTERLDQSLKRATQPIDHSCERVKLIDSSNELLFEIGIAERAVIAAPLSAPTPERNWIKAKIRFERINRKTGKALFNFDNEGEETPAHYCLILDSDVRKPHNHFTKAFDDDIPLHVWVRQTHPEKGRLNLQWEVTTNDPKESALFDKQDPDMRA